MYPKEMTEEICIDDKTRTFVGSIFIPALHLRATTFQLGLGSTFSPMAPEVFGFVRVNINSTGSPLVYSEKEEKGQTSESNFFFPQKYVQRK